MNWEKVVLDERRETKGERLCHPERSEGSKKTLSDVCEFIVDCPHSTANDEGVGYPLIRTPNVGKGRLILTDVHRVSEDVYNARNFRAVPQEDDLIFAREAPAGNVALIRKGEKVCLGQRTVLLRPNKHLVDPCFLTYFLLAPKQQYKLTRAANGATVAHINLPTIRNLVIDVPDIKNQKKIGLILSAYDNLIENNNKRIKILEQMAENLYKEWFVRFRFPGHETTPIENGIPKGWEYKRADEVIDFNPTIKTDDQKNFTIIPMEALSTSSMVIDSNSFIIQDTISGRRSQNGDTLLAKITPCLENGKTGFVMGLPEGEVFGGSTEFIVMRSKTLTPHYVYCIARSQYFRQTAILSMNGADGRQRVDENKLKSTKILQPTQTLLNHFEKNVSPLFESISRLVKENTNLIKQRDLLLPRLMSGKLAV